MGRVVKKVRRLSALVFVLWGAWLGMLLYLYVQHRLAVMHPHFLPLITLLLVQALAAIGLLVGGVWRLARGPKRVQALAWLCVGTFPLWLSSTYGTYLAWSVSRHDLGFRAHGLHAFGILAAAGLGDLETRYRYPERVEGRQTVMWTDHAGGGERDVAAMDAHIERLADSLGQTCRAKVHWMRGGLLGQHGKYVQGIALGSRRADWSGDLKYLDKHEAAHFAIEHLCGPDADTPTLLIEGWAEVHSGYESGLLARRAWKWKRENAVFTLQELVNDQWYDRFLFPVYEHGGPLVEYILRTWGGERFFELYSTCGRDTFAEDCERILGVSLDGLDRAYWEDIERQMTSPELQSTSNPLLSVKRAAGVDEDHWRQIATEHWTAMERARETLRQAIISYSVRWESRKGGESRPFYVHRADVKQDWPRVRVVSRAENEDGTTHEVVVADPRCSFVLSRRDGESKWTAKRIGGSEIPKYDMIAAWERTGRASDLLNHSFRRYWSEYESPDEDPLVTSLGLIERDGRRFWRVDYEVTVRVSPTAEHRVGWFLLAPDRNWTSQEEEFTVTRKGESPSRRRKTIEYDPAPGGLPILRTVRETTLGDAERVWRLEVSNVEFGPVTPDAFTPEAFGVSFDELTTPSPVPSSVWISVAGSAGSLLGAAVLFSVSGWLRRRNSAPDRAPGEAPS